MRGVHVAETDEKAHEEARQFVGIGEERIGRGAIAETRIGWGSNSRGMGRDSELFDNKRRGEIMAQGRARKILVFKKKRRKNYRRRHGHRQAITTVRVIEIV